MDADKPPPPPGNEPPGQSKETGKHDQQQPETLDISPENPELIQSIGSMNASDSPKVKKTDDRTNNNNIQEKDPPNMSAANGTSGINEDTAEKVSPHFQHDEQDKLQSEITKDVTSPIPVILTTQDFRETPIRSVKFKNPSITSEGGATNHTKPLSPRKNTPTKRDYKTLYEDVKQRFVDYSSKTESKLSKLQQDYDLLQIKYEAEINSYKMDYSEREAIITTENADLKNKLTELEKKATDIDSMKVNYEHLISEKEAILKEQIDKVKELEERSRQEIPHDTSCHGIHRIKSDEEIFRLRPKGRQAKNPTDKLACDFQDCSQKNVDLVQCNMCSKWVCEECNDVQVAKLKPILNKCKTIHFLCKNCDEKIGTQQVPGTPETTGHPINEDNLLASLQKMLDTKVNQMESKIEKAIDKKFEDKLAAITTLNEKLDSNGEVITATASQPSYAKVLELPAEVRKIMIDARNDEKVENNEQERRSQNFIIHGAEEVGDDDDEIKENDEYYVDDILECLSVNAEPKSITRIGKPNEKKKRVLKIVMKSTADKDKVMNNLRKLKGTEKDFGKISVTHDYTSTDREKIKEFTNKAKQKSEEDPTRVYKVRGDPKNGLRIVSFAKP